MGTVYEVFDLASGRGLALKRLHAELEPRRQRRMVELFEREFYTLSQIAHPCVVAVYDYGVDAQGPFYTMELLPGRELPSLGPVPWRVACRYGRDLCSALSLLHSRRLVYRDLNPRNVHCTPDGSAKLIDFGATTSMGPCSQVVGTPGYCAPEAIDLQPLDARTDLYSLGATLYFMLTNRHAYPAKTFDQLRNAWLTRPTRPAELVSDVPAALDALVMDLLHLDPGVRSASAAEVMEQLTVIEGHALNEQAQVTQAYLSSPNLVGREAVLARVQAKLARALRGYGGALILSGSSGSGRTRLLSACSIAAKLLGALVLRADAADAASGDYGAVQGLVAQLLEAVPELALACARAKSGLLCQAIPELALRLAQPAPTAVADDPIRQRAQTLAALREWFFAISAQRSLVICVDDVHQIDEPSAAFLALCAHDASKHACLLLVSSDPAASASSHGAWKLLEAAASSIGVASLSAGHTEQLLRSVFGDVPQVQAIAQKLHAIADGNPRDIMQLAQYLVDRGLARYRSGAWSLPTSFDDTDLPANMAQALRAQVRALSSRARELAQLMVLSVDRSITFEECCALSPDTAPKQVMDSLDQLVAAQVVKRVAGASSIAHRGLCAALAHDLSPADEQRLHLLLAELFARRSHEEFRRAQHLLHGGAAKHGLDVFVAFAEHSQSITDVRPHEYLKLVASLPDRWLEVYVQFIALCEQLQRPARDLYLLRNRLAGLLNVMRAPGAVSHAQLILHLRQLSWASGLDDFAVLAQTTDSADALRRALAAAQARYDSSSEHERLIAPRDAIRQLVRLLLATAGMAAVALDHELWSALPSVAAFAPLSASVAVADQLAAGIGARITGRLERARAIYARLIERLAQPDRAGLDATNHLFLLCGLQCGIGMLEAGMGLDSCVRWADAIDHEPLHQVNALNIRMLHQLWQGNVREADQLKDRIELLRIESSPRQLQEGMHVIGQLSAHAQSDDLTRVKYVVDEIRVLAQRHPGWSHVFSYAIGEYQRVRGDHASALPQLAAALAGTRAGTHQIWPYAQGCYVRVLSSLGRASEAVQEARSGLLAAEQAGLGYLCNFIKMPYALALARTGELAQAEEVADEVIGSFHELGSQGLNMVLAYEARARVAICADDSAGFERFARLCAGECRRGGSRVLLAKYERLNRSAMAAAVLVSDAPPSGALTTLLRTQLTSVLVGCDNPRERAERTLMLLLRASGCSEGFLYLVAEHGPQLCAQAGPNEAPLGLPLAVSDCISAELQARDLHTGSLEIDGTDAIEATHMVWDGAQGERHQLVVLSHRLPMGFAITGVAALLLEPGASFVHPGALAAHLSRLTLDAGDVTPILSE